MRPKEEGRARALGESLHRYGLEVRPLPGINDPAACAAFIEQLLESARRVQYVIAMRMRDVSPRRADPTDPAFDPLMAAVVHQRQGNVEEAFWLVFLFVHFGKHVNGGYRYVREVYGRLGGPGRWDWASTSRDPEDFRNWLRAHTDVLRRTGVPGGFGNHRKYESLDADSPAGTAAVVASYVRWVAPPRTHVELVDGAVRANGGDARRTFDALYRSMDAVARFGRTARFDYLTMLGKLELAPVSPGSAYLVDATGPATGARMLFGHPAANTAARVEMDGWLVELGDRLGVGMQILEDALCNWQKSPGRFRSFRG